MQELLLRLVLGTFPFELFNDRACWGSTLLISCWYVWRDIVKAGTDMTEQRPTEQSNEESKDFGPSGRTLEKAEQVHEEPEDESQVGTIYDSENPDVDSPRS